jgi:hypothetical protein
VRLVATICAVVGAGLAVAAGGACGGGGDAPAATAALKADRFDADRAWADLEMQVALGPRPAGSEASRRLAEEIRERLPKGRFEEVPGGLRNVVGRLPGRGRRHIVLGAHYDTKDIPGFVGANDGASGTAVLLELARVLERTDRPPGSPKLRFVFFDGEESPDDDADFYSTGVRGSKAYVKRHAGRVKAVVLLDFVGEKDLQVPRESSSSLKLWSRLRAAAAKVGAGSTFPDETGETVLDDHTPFLEEGIKAIDLIDFDFDCFHQTCDDLDVVSRRSLDRVGETVLRMVLDWGR